MMRQVLLICALGLLICAAQAEPPVINTQPVDEFVFEGETAEFNVDAINPTTGDTTDLTYQWKKVVDGTDDPNLSTTDTLTISDVNTITDPGYYYCIVGIVGLDDANSVTTDYAKLVAKDLVAHYTFDKADFVDGQYLDKSGYGRHATVNQAPTTFDVGANGDLEGAVSLFDYPTAWAAAGTWDPAAFSNEATISTWVRLDENAAAVDSSLTQKRTGGGWNDARWDFIVQGARTLWFNLNPNLGISDFSCETAQWKHLCLTISADNVAKVYEDGVLFRSYSGWQLGAQVDAEIYLGARGGGSAPVQGAIDDYRFYNYALTADEIAGLYIGQVGGYLCVSKPALDFNDDCIVNLGDLEVFAASWLESGLVADGN